MILINFSIIGTGLMAGVIAKELTENFPGTCLYSVLSRTKNKSLEFGKKFNIPLENCFCEEELFFKDKGINVVYIATPTSEKERYLSYAVENNINVIIEKPIPISENALKIYEIAKNKKLKIIDATHCVYNEIFNSLDENVEQYVGDIHRVEANFCWPSDDNLQVTKMNPKLEYLGALGDLCWYPSRLLMELTDGRLEMQSYLLTNKIGSIIESNVSGYVGKVSFTLFSSYRGSTATQYIYLSGSKGEIIINDFVMPYWGSFVYGDIQRYSDIVLRSGMKPFIDIKSKKIFFTGNQHGNMIQMFLISFDDEGARKLLEDNFAKAIKTAVFLNKIFNDSHYIS